MMNGDRMRAQRGASRSGWRVSVSSGFSPENVKTVRLVTQSYGWLINPILINVHFIDKVNLRFGIGLLKVQEINPALTRSNSGIVGEYITGNAAEN